MAVVIRLKRLGTKKKASLRIVVMTKSVARDGRTIEEIGRYDPTFNPPKMDVNAERAKYWLGVGAVPSETVKSVLKKLKVI